MKKPYNVKISITNDEGVLLNYSSFEDYKKEAIESDLSCGYEIPEISIKDYADCIKDEIIREYNLLTSSEY